MPTGDYQSALEHLGAALETHWSSFAPLADDLEIFIGAYSSWADRLGKRVWLSEGPEDPLIQDQVAAQHAIGMRMDAMLRAAIVFGDITNSLALGAVFGASVNGQARQITSLKGGWASRLDADVLARAHALRQYRNGLVVHFDTRRVETSSFRGDHTQRTLMPVDTGAETPNAHSRIGEIAARHSNLASIEAVLRLPDGRVDFWSAVKALFYALPPLDNGSSCPDRKYVDSLVKKYGGVDSMTVAEVLTTVTDFIDALADRVDAEGRPVSA